MFLLLEIFSGEFFTNENPFNPIQILGIFLLLSALILIPIPLLLFPKKREENEHNHFFDVPQLINTGIYGVIRHPQYLGWAFIMIGLIFLRQEFIGAIFGCLGLVLLNYCAKIEENNLVIKFGEEYEIYQSNVPRWNIIFGIYRYFLKRDP